MAPCCSSNRLLDMQNIINSGMQSSISTAALPLLAVDAHVDCDAAKEAEAMIDPHLMANDLLQLNSGCSSGYRALSTESLKSMASCCPASRLVRFTICCRFHLKPSFSCHLSACSLSSCPGSSMQPALHSPAHPLLRSSPSPRVWPVTRHLLRIVQSHARMHATPRCTSIIKQAAAYYCTGAA